MTVHQIETRAERLWREYTRARDLAERSSLMADGVAAARAWSAFMEEYLPPEDLVRTVRDRDDRRAAR